MMRCTIRRQPPSSSWRIPATGAARFRRNIEVSTSPILRIYSKSQTYLSIISNSVSHNLISAKQKKKAENYPLYIRQRLLTPIYQKCLANASPQPLYLRPKRGGSQFQLLRKSNSTPQRAKSISPVFTNANSSG